MYRGSLSRGSGEEQGELMGEWEVLHFRTFASSINFNFYLTVSRI